MNNYLHASGYLLVSLLTVLLIGCDKVVTFESSIYFETFDFPDSETQVSWNQINDYAHRCSPKTRSDGDSDYSICAIVGESADTLLYIINYGNGAGWKILSADNRTPAVIAESESGSFSLGTDNKSVGFWLDCIVHDMSIIRQSDNESLNFTKDEIAANKSFWGIEGQRSQPLVPDPGGYWAESITSEEIIVEEVNHMTPHWDQMEPYNRYSPLKSNSQIDRAPAGCVAVAGAEVLYYLHNHLGVPTTMVSEGFCYGDINNYSREFTSLNTSIWEAMDTNYVSNLTSPYAEALMIGYVGSLSLMSYHNNYSWTYPARLRTNVFEPMGISCSHGNYNAVTVKNNLDNGLPIIVTASDLLIPLDFEIHCFVIDGYKKTYTKYRHHHYFVPDDPDMVFPPGVNESYDTYTFSSTDITAIKINWGWWSQWRPVDPLNDGWYSLTDDWYTINSQGHEATYNHNRQMIYGFSVSE